MEEPIKKKRKHNLKVIRRELCSFLALPTNSAWLKASGMQVYVRKSKRVFIINGARELLPAFDIASAVVEKPGEGRFTSFLAIVRELNPYPVLFVENVMVPRFADFFRRQGFTEMKDGLMPPCFYEFKPKAGEVAHA